MMKSGTPNSNGRCCPLRANVTAVVMMNPHPMASIPPRSAPVARRPSRMPVAVSCNGIGEHRAMRAMNRQPTILPARMRRRFHCSPFFMNPAVPVYSFSP